MTQTIKDQTIMGFFNELAGRIEKSRASDLHLQQGEVPAIRVVGGLLPQTDLGTVSGEMLFQLLETFVSPEEIAEFDTRGSLDAGIQLPNMRFRVNAFKHLNGLAISFRHIPPTPPEFSKLGLPAVVKRLAALPRGLVIFCGPTGSGKSTTAASLIHMINASRNVHIITIEEPIEYIHKSKSALIAQREVGKHTATFSDGLREALREDPNIILVGEMRDLETIELALRAAETGHLVFSTLHTSGAAASIGRIVDAFEGSARPMVQTQLSHVLMGVVSQILIPSRDGTKRVAICEVLIPNDAVRHLIRENKLEQIPNIIQSGGSEGMISFAAHIAELTKTGVIDSSGGLEAVGEAWRIADLMFEK